MAEEIRKRRERGEVETETENKSEAPAPGGSFGLCLAVQTAVCAALLLAAFGLRSFAPELFAGVSAQYCAVIDRPVDYEALMNDSFGKIRAWIAREADHVEPPAPSESRNADD